MTLSKGRRALLGRLERRKARAREELVLVEGVRALDEALDAGAELRFGVASPRVCANPEGERVAERLSVGGDLVWVTDEQLDALSATSTPQGILAVFREPTAGLESCHERAVDGLVVLDGIQDPGNVGALVRTASAFGVGAVIALDGSADPWGAKAVRSSAGRVFRLPVLRARWSEVDRFLSESSIPLWVAHQEGIDPIQAGSHGPWALAVGNEGEGVRDELRERAARVVSVAMPGGGDSLNVAAAGAILMYLLKVRPTQAGPDPEAPPGTRDRRID